MNGTIQIKSAMFLVTGTYNDMTLRPYQPNFRDGNIGSRFLEATNGGQAVTPETTAGVAGDFLVPSADHIGVAHIDSGWQQQRLRFIMHLTVTQPSSMGANHVSHKMIQGYTDYVGFDQHGNADPNMRLFFNGVINYTESSIQTPYGQNTRLRPISTEQIMLGTPRVQPGNPIQTTRLMRPRDVFSSMSVMNVLDLGLNDAEQNYGHHPQTPRFTGHVEDHATPFVGAPAVKSSRNYNRSGHYVSSVFNAMAEADRDIEEDNWGVADPSTHTDRWSVAQGKINQEDSMQNDPFFGRLNVETTFCEGGSVTYGELAQLAPEIDHPSVSTVYFDRQVQKAQDTVMNSNLQGMFPDRAVRGNSEHWGGSGIETIWATVLNNSVPSIMLDCFLTRLAFHATNQTLDGQVVVTILDAHTIMGGQTPDLQGQIQQFQSRLEHEIIRSLSRGNYIDFNLTMHTHVIGDTHIRLSVAGDHEVLFTTPTFSDAAFSPILAPNERYVNNVGHQFRAFADDVETRLRTQQTVAHHNGGNEPNINPYNVL